MPNPIILDKYEDYYLFLLAFQIIPYSSSSEFSTSVAAKLDLDLITAILYLFHVPSLGLGMNGLLF